MNARDVPATLRAAHESAATRSVNAGAAAAAKEAAASGGGPSPPMRKPQAPPMRSGKDYVESSKQQQRRKPAKPAGADKDDAEEFETAKKAMSDLDKFDAQYGGSADEY